MNEFSLIERYFMRDTKREMMRALQPASILLGIGDDAALIQPPIDQTLAITTDTLIAGRHFPIHTDPYSIGWKSVAVNLSDLAAMGAAAHSILLAISLPTTLAQNNQWMQAFADGVFACCALAKVSLIGGDTTQSEILSITITALGFTPITQTIKRSGAQVGDLIVVSGTLGDAAFALQHPSSILQPRLDQPTPRLALGLALRGLASAGLDISDGFVQDLQHILKASGVGAQIKLDALPLSPTLKALPQVQQWQYALAGGDDYELCFTLAPDDFARLKGKALDVNCTVVGHITSEEGISFSLNNEPVTLDLNSLKGYQHFE